MITDEQKLSVLQQYKDHGDLKKEIRSYEVSLWTLQDEFLTVLKWSDIEQQGRIENPILKINVDGTQSFSCSIPMYYRVYNNPDDTNNGKLVENPNWYSVKSGQLIMGLRKLKIIFNKGSEDAIEDDDERAKIRSSNVFELLITKVTETHEQDQLRCNIECEGLAFHELGKVGYKLDLSQDNFLLNKQEWDESSPQRWLKRDGTYSTEEPVENVQYWCEQCDLIRKPSNSSDMRSSQWYYDIQMNWESFEDGSSRATDIVYEESYVSSWNSALKAQTIEAYREKYRPITISESNIYNITQTIAETFGIYCKYVYGYDDNYHITSRTIVFYNNYFNEDELISFTYPYVTRQISREMDATEVTTKMFVRPQDNDTVVSGQINIVNCAANKTREDYLLNFDYLYTCGGINQEQYDAIPQYEKDIRNLNVEIEELALQINAQEKIKSDNEALATVYKNSIALDQESISSNSELYNRLDSSDGAKDGYFTRGKANPYTTYIKQDATGRYYISLSTEDKGLDPSHLQVYRVYHSTKLTFSNPLNSYSVVYDKYNMPKELTLSNFSPTFTTSQICYTMDAANWTFSNSTDTNINVTESSSMLVYLVYRYQPELYYNKVNAIWVTKLDNDTAAYEAASAQVAAATTALETLNANYEEKLAQKNNLIQSFNRMMGPALREGYWQPDEYKDYGDSHSTTGALSNTFNEYVMINGTNNGIAVGWDKTLFDGEDTNYYEEGVLQTKVYYQCIELNSSLLSKIRDWLSAGKVPAFVFNNNYYKPLTSTEKKLIQNVTIFSLGSEMQLGFLSSGSNIKPVLILTGTKSMTDEQITFMKGGGNPRLGIVTTATESITTNGVTDVRTTATLSNDSADVSNRFLSSLSSYFIIYPRIKISSNDLDTNSIFIKYNGTILNNFVDYSILSRVTNRVDKAYFEYFITIKPEVLYKVGSYTQSFSVQYTLSNAATCVYLDAVQVMTDSSKPRVSYTVDVNILNIDYLNTLYRNLTQLVAINDFELKFENTFGYISGIELNLDKPWEDKIEVKNYKTKFEDLFSTIVASSEGMRQNAAAYDAAANGMIPLKEDALIKMISDNSKVLSMYLDAGLDESAHVKAVLSDIFTEAGAIIAASNSALNNVRSLTLRNAEILQGFVSNISEELTPKVVNSQNQPTEFKVGDVWNKIDPATGEVIGRYVATSSSEDSSNGFTRTYDGTLAAIRGASLDVDAVAGTISLEAENRIDIKSGSDLYIAANNKVDIVGNKEVNIGGTTINIAAATTEGTVGGINIVATRYDSVTDADNNVDNTSTTSLSKVLIHPDQIEMGSANILMRGSNKIQIITSRNTLSSTSAISLDPANGIWIGSGAGIKLYSGNVNLTEQSDGTFTVSGGAGASVELMPDYLILGVSNTTDATTAIEMTKDYLVIGNGQTINGTDVSKIATGINGLSTGLIGAKFTKDSIGFATMSNNVVNAILMNNNGIVIGSGVNFTNLPAAESITNGSYIHLAAEGIDIGATSHLRIITSNFILNSAPANATASILEIKYTENSNLITGIKFTQSAGLYVRGNIINETIQLINTTYEGRSSGLYVTNSIQEHASIQLNGNIYYAWKVSGTSSPYYYMINSITGSSYSVQGNETILIQYRKKVSVTPKYYVLVQESVTDPNDSSVILYNYQEMYIGSNNTTAFTYTKNGVSTKIKYDGSTTMDLMSSPQVFPAWYTELMQATSNNVTPYVDYHEGDFAYQQAILTVGTVLVPVQAAVTFSVNASDGSTIINKGEISNFKVTPEELANGKLVNTTMQQAKIADSTIESYHSQYYGRCFYDYHLDRDSGILTLTRVDSTTVTLDIGAIVKKTLEGGTIGDAPASSGGGSSDGCNGNCTGSCSGGCDTTCNQYCTTTCYQACANSCQTGCGGNCSSGCKGGCKGSCETTCTMTCANNCEVCSNNCGSECASGCTGGCERICTASCTSVCKGSTEGGTSCGSSCTTRCMNDCVGNSY